MLQISSDGRADIGGRREDLLTPTVAARAQVAAVRRHEHRNRLQSRY